MSSMFIDNPDEIRQVLDAVEKKRKKKKKKKKEDDVIKKYESPFPGLSTWSGLGTLILVAALGLYFAPVSTILIELGSFLTFNLEGVHRNSTSFLGMFPVLLLIVAIELALALVSLVVIKMSIGNSKDFNAVNKLMWNMSKDGHHFTSLFVGVLLEEVVARWFFLGLLTKIGFLSGPVGFYALVLIGNTLFAAVHFSNYKNKEDWHVLRVVPQFIAGLFFSYLFLKYGLLACVLAHFASNAIIFAQAKVQDFDGFDGLIIAFDSLILFASLALMNKPMSDMLVWFNGEGQFKLEGWGFGDYLLASLVVGCVFSLVFDLLCYDRADSDVPGDIEKYGFLGFLGAYSLSAVLVVLIIYAGFWVTGLVVDDVPYRIVLLSILLMFLVKYPSGSAAMRGFWSALPNTYITICIIEALGFFAGMLFVFVQVIINLPNYYLGRASK